MFKRGLPDEQGLYNPANEHDNCGIGFVANIKNLKSHEKWEELSNLNYVPSISMNLPKMLQK